MLEKISHMVLLKDFYGPLLTEKQQDVLHMHYENDWSLSEIASIMKTSRQAVYDLLKRSETLLEEYEQKLGLVNKFQQTRNRLEQLSVILEDSAIDKRSVSQALKILKEITGLL